MRKFGLIGYPLSHSFSKTYFSTKFKNEGIENAWYELYPLRDIAELRSIIAMPALQGLNVTIPYKETVIEYLDELDSEAEAVGAVNTILIRDGKLKGFNTDVFGFEQSLLPLLKKWHKKALVLGSGGAAKAVSYALDKLEIDRKIVSRQAAADKLSYKQLSEREIAANTLIINTTPLGMHPHINASPALPYQYLTPDHLLYDLVYNPEVTSFLQQGKEQGATIKNGLEMLHLQAERAWEIWNA